MALIPFPGSNAALTPDDDPDDELESEDAGGKMSFLEHLDELRQRLIVSIIAVVVGFLIAFVFIDYIFAFVMRPLQQILPSGGRLIYTEATEAFMLQLKMSALAGVVLAAPVIMWQLWLFIAPGLYSREKRFALPFVLFSTVFFVGGVAFAHYVVFPAAWKFFASFNNDYMEFMPKVSEAFGLYAYMLLAFGIIFQMPTLVLALARMGVVTAGFLWRHTKYAILLIFIASAVITPSSDVVNQSLMAVPMLALYLLSIGIAWVFGRRRSRRIDD
jgi:sec-independent protein translocase protein TatC